MEKDNFLTKEQSVYLKGWAILFMMFLHFGGNAVAPAYRYSWSDSEWHGGFQICVPIFLFLSGYGLMVSTAAREENLQDAVLRQIRRVFKLFRHYWFVTFPFIGLALLTGKFVWSWENFVLTATSLRCVYCPNAWFVSLYVELILLFPFLSRLVQAKSLGHNLSVFLVILVLTKLLGKIEWIDAEASILARQIKMVLIDMPIFIEGMLFAKYVPWGKVLLRLPYSTYLKLCGGAILVALSIMCRAKVPLVSITELVHVPICLLGLLLICSESSKCFKIYHFIGRHSTTLWFIHGYVCWTFFQPFIYSIRFWPLAFVLFASISLLLSLGLDRMLKY